MGFIADIFTADKAADAQKDASKDSAKASQYATDKTIGLHKEIFDKIWGGTQLQRDAGNAATAMMAKLMGLSIPGQQPGQAPAPGQPAGQQPSAQPQTLPAQVGSQVGNALAYRSDKPSHAVAITGDRFENGMISNNYGYSPINQIGAGGQSPGNALNPAAPAPVQVPNTGATAPAAPFDATAWLRSTPGYEVNFNEGARATNHALASRGALFSGDAGREMTRFGQNYADRIYGDQFNRLASIAGAGQTATSQGGQAGQNYANQSGNALQNNAANLGSSYQNRGNAISGFWGNVNGSIHNTTNAIGQMMMGGF